MPPTHDDAICLRHREWSETSQTVTLLTRRHGLVHGLAKGSQREKSPYSGGFELLQLGELGFINKPDRDLLLLTEWDLIDPFPGLRTDFRAATMAMFAAEMTASLLAPLDPHPEVFTALHAYLDERSGGDDAARSLSVYLDSLLVSTGQGVEADDGDPARVAGRGEPDAIWAFDPARNLFSPDPARAKPADDPFEPTVSPAGVWHLRAETLAALRSIRAGAGGGGPDSGAAWLRTARFLAACACYRAARRPSSLEAFLRVTRFEGGVR